MLRSNKHSSKKKYGITIKEDSFLLYYYIIKCFNLQKHASVELQRKYAQ